MTPSDTLVLPQMPPVDMAMHDVLPLAWQIGPSLALGLLVGLTLSFGRTKLFAFLRTLLNRTNTPPTVVQWAFHMLDALKGWFIWSTALYLAIRLAPPAQPLFAVADYVFALLAFLQLGIALGKALTQGSQAYMRANQADGARVTLVATLALIAHMLIWALIALMVLSRSGINVTGLLAGLGLGGVVIALAFKKMAEDMFGAFSIVMDKPFVLGDFIITGDFMGTVEHIGLKTTRLRALSGEQAVISNSDLLSSRIRNYGRMMERRQLFTLGVTYETPLDKLEAIPGIIQTIIEAQPDVRFDRCTFATYGDFSLGFETVYYVLSPDYNRFMAIQQDINLAIFKAFADHGIDFAYPTQLVYTRPAR